MAPINLKHSPNPSSTDARALVRETLRISANLASSLEVVDPLPAETTTSRSSVASFPSSSLSAVELECRIRIGGGTVGVEDFVNPSSRLICCEEIDGRRWKYIAESDGNGGFKKNSFRALSLQSPQAPIDVSFQSHFFIYTLISRLIGYGFI